MAAECAAGVMPAGMTGRLNDTTWLRTTPMGGKYNWENNQLHFGVRNQAAIAISATASAPLVLDVPQLYDVEREIDGNSNLLGGISAWVPASIRFSSSSHERTPGVHCCVAPPRVGREGGGSRIWRHPAFGRDPGAAAKNPGGSRENCGPDRSTRSYRKSGSSPRRENFWCK